MYWIIFIGFSLLSWIIGNRLNASFKAYSKIPTENNFTGKEVAEKMLRDNDITDVSVRCVEGQLTDAQKQAVINHISKRMSHWNKPREVQCVDKFPRTKIGKINIEGLNYEFGKDTQGGQ